MIYVVAVTYEQGRRELADNGLDDRVEVRDNGMRVRRARIITKPEDVRGLRFRTHDQVVVLDGVEDRPDWPELLRELEMLRARGDVAWESRKRQKASCHCGAPRYDPEDYLCKRCRNVLYL